MTRALWPDPIRTAARSIGALTCGAALLAAPPAALIRYVGWPLPRSLSALPTASSLLTQPLSEDLLINALACLSWLLWALFIASLSTELFAAARGTTAPRIPGLHPLQALAAAIISAATVALVTLTTRAQPLPADNLIAAAAVLPNGAHQPAPEVPDTYSSSTIGNGQRTNTYRVAPYDSLWSIAEQQLGDPYRWRDLYQLNRGRPQPDGDALHQPPLIRPGWILLLPHTNTDPPTPPQQGKPNPSASHTPPQPRPPTRSAPTPSPPAQPPAAPPTATTEPRTSPVPTPTSFTRPPQEPTNPAPSRTDQGPQQPHGAVHLPSGAIIGTTLVTALATAIAIARLRRARRRIPTSVPGTTPPEPPLPGVGLIETARTGQHAASPSHCSPATAKTNLRS
jgi:hypothetical protein